MKLVKEMITIPIDRIQPNPWNPNRQTDFIFEKERHSIREHGFFDPVTTRELEDGSFEIIDGEHRWKAAKLEGYTELTAMNLGKIDDSVAKQLTLIANDTRGENDPEKFRDLLQDLEADIGLDALLSNLPYHENIINNAIDQAKVD